MKKRILTIISCAMIVLASCTGRNTGDISGDRYDPGQITEQERTGSDYSFAALTDDPGSISSTSYVPEIDDDSLYDQVACIRENTDKWIIPEGYDTDVRSISYTVTDLDRNGRIEMLSVIAHEDEFAEVSIYEVTEDHRDLAEAKWTAGGMDITRDWYPEFIDGVYENYSCLELSDGITHYMMNGFFGDPDLDYGIAYIDFTYSDGIADSYIYGAVLFPEDGNFICKAEEGSEIDDYDEFMEYIRSHWHRDGMDVQEFGLYTANYAYYDALKEFDDVDLFLMLRDSYYVFCGRMKAGEFSGLYNTLDDFGMRYENVEFYESIIGKWTVTSSGDPDVIEHFTDTPYSFTMEFCDDHTVHARTEFNGEILTEEVYDVRFEEDGHPLFEAYDDSSYSYFGHEEYIVDSVSEDGNTLTVMCARYDADGYISDTETFVFTRS